MREELLKKLDQKITEIKRLEEERKRKMQNEIVKDEKYYEALGRYVDGMEKIAMLIYERNRLLCAVVEHFESVRQFYCPGEMISRMNRHRLVDERAVSVVSKIIEIQNRIKELMAEVNQAAEICFKEKICLEKEEPPFKGICEE